MWKRRIEMIGALLCLAVPIASVAFSALQSPVTAEQTNLELTVYNQDLALVKEHRPMELKVGVNEIRFSDVPSQIDPTSVHFKSLTDPEGTEVWEQNYEYDLVSTAKLLQKYVDQEISLITEDGTEYAGTLLSGSDDIILETDEGIKVVKLSSVRDFSFPALPEGLITKPTLVWLIHAEKEGEHETEVTYLTGGINWRADYVALLGEDDDEMSLNGWVTVDNRSGASYENAKLKLIAGDIHRVVEEGRVLREALMMEKAVAAGPQVEEREFFEYHLYEVQRPVTVRNNQTKQIEFVAANEIPVEKIFVYDGAQLRFFPGYGPLTDRNYGTSTNTKVQVMLEVRNEEELGLGIALPKGKVRVYKEDVDGGVELIGEDLIDHTPKDERIMLYLGDAFDVVGERVQTDFRRLGDKSLEESYKITIRNHKDTAVEVRVVEHMFRWSEWEITHESLKSEKIDAQTVEYRVRVPADGEREVTYTVLYRW